MSTIIQIKRTNTANLPSTLDQGELAYIYDTSSISKTAGGLGDRLYIGDPTSNTNNPIKIGGKYYVDMLDHTKGVLTANGALIVNGDKKLDNIKIDNLDLNGNTLSSTDANGDIFITPDGTGKTIISNLYTDADTSLREFIEDITGGQVLAGTALEVVYDEVAGTVTISVANNGIDTAQLADNAVTEAKLSSGSVTTDKISDLSVTTAKIADSNITSIKLADGAILNGKIANGAITNDKISDNTIENSKLANNFISIGNNNVTLGDGITDVSGITSLAVDNLTIDTNSITATNTDGDIGLLPNGQGTITVPAGYEQRSSFTDNSLVNKKYVDQVAQGLDVKEAVVAATELDLDATYDNTAGTLTGNSNGAISVDGVELNVGDRVLVKDQTDLISNGIYEVTTKGVDGTSAFVLTRAPDADTAEELSGGSFFFVEKGTKFADAGFVATHDGIPTFGTTEINFEQFSGAGAIAAGSAIGKNGNTLNVLVDNTTIEVNGTNNLQLKDDGITNSKISASAAINQSKLNLNSATTRANSLGISQADLGVVSFDSSQFSTTNGWATVVRLDAGVYS